jgi:hypothetical protein
VLTGTAAAAAAAAVGAAECQLLQQDFGLPLYTDMRLSDLHLNLLQQTLLPREEGEKGWQVKHSCMCTGNS